MHPRTRRRLATVHRWLAVALSPVILLIILSGGVLAFRPIVRRSAAAGSGAPDSRPRHRVDVARLIALVKSSAATDKPFFVGTSESGDTAIIVGRSGPKAYVIATGAAAPLPQEVTRQPDVFDIAERIHKDLWFGLGGLVTLGSIAMILLVILGPILSRPRRGGGTLGGHIRAGWWAWPLVALLPLSLVAMKIHGGAFGRPEHPIASMSEAIQSLPKTMDATRLVGMQLLPNGRAFFVMSEPSGPTRYFLSDGVASAVDGPISRTGRALHTGTWAGPWSGMLNLVCAAAMLWMMWTGLRSFVQRRRVRRTVPVPAAPLDLSVKVRDSGRLSTDDEYLSRSHDRAG